MHHNLANNWENVANKTTTSAGGTGGRLKGEESPY